MPSGSDRMRLEKVCGLSILAVAAAVASTAWSGAGARAGDQPTDDIDAVEASDARAPEPVRRVPGVGALDIHRAAEPD